MSKLENTPENEKRLTPEEALMHQSYAAKINRKSFSEKASSRAYAEADKLIEKLRDKKFDWLNIDWDKFDSMDLRQVKGVESRLDSAVRILVDEGKLDEETTSFVKKYRGVIIPLAISVGIIMGISGAVGELYALDQKEVSRETKLAQLQDVVDNTGEFHPNAIEQLANWKKAHPEITRIVLKEMFSDEQTSDEGIVEYKGSAKIILLLKDGRAIVLEGASLESPAENSAMLKQLGKWTKGKTWGLTENAFVGDVVVPQEALDDALSQY